MGGVHALVRDMTAQQMRLMKEGEGQEQNLLLGVLMTKQKEPMEAQLKVLRSAEFSGIPAVAAVLAAKDLKTPLVKQVADFIDKQSGNSSVEGARGLSVDVSSEIPQKLSIRKAGKPDVTGIVNALQVRLHHIEDSERRRKKLHAEEMRELDVAMKK